WIRVGRISTVPAGQNPEIDPLARIVERLKLVPFQNQVLKSIGIAKNSPAAGLYRKSLALKPMPYAGSLIKLTLRASSPQAARRLTEATLKQLQTAQQQLRTMPLAQARSDLEEIENELKETIGERTRLLRTLTAGTRDGKTTQNALIANLTLSSENNEIHDLQRQRNNLVNRMSSTYTYDTSLAWPIYVPRSPVFPNRLLARLLGVLAGLCLGATVAVARDAMRRSRIAPAPLPSPALRVP
ncbi:MAG: Wzz/FepE/Etk N-terminal domain-containing protein, partial [Rhodanobacteraceae bacterium]